MGTGLVIAILLVSVVFIANNTAGNFVQQDEYRRRMQGYQSYADLIAERKKNEDLQQSILQKDDEIRNSELVRRRASPDYISDAEIIED